MAPQLPEMPKISGFIEPLTKPEVDIAAQIKGATKIELPLGPGSMVLNIAKSVEAGRSQGGSPQFKLPRLEEALPKLPAGMPKLPAGLLGLPELPGMKKEVVTGNEKVLGEAPSAMVDKTPVAELPKIDLVQVD